MHCWWIIQRNHVDLSVCRSRRSSVSSARWSTRTYRTLRKNWSLLETYWLRLPSTCITRSHNASCPPRPRYTTSLIWEISPGSVVCFSSVSVSSGDHHYPALNYPYIFLSHYLLILMFLTLADLIPFRGRSPWLHFSMLLCSVQALVVVLSYPGSVVRLSRFPPSSALICPYLFHESRPCYATGNISAVY